jgi:UDP-glucose 4-epimerase
MMEKVAIAKSRTVDPTNTTICVTRYGNVMASRGSVIPLFVEQIKAGKPLTVTDPNMTRFLMNLDEAVDLVLYAFEHANQGDLFVQKSPASTVETLAKALIEMFDAKSEIKIIGTRHGEKADETLMTREEKAKSIEHEGYYQIPADTRDLNYDKFFVKGDKEVEKAIEYTSENTERLDIKGTKTKLLTVDYVVSEVEGRTGQAI